MRATVCWQRGATPSVLPLRAACDSLRPIGTALANEPGMYTRWRRWVDDERGAVMPEYVIVTALSVAIAAAIGAMSVVLGEANERARELIHMNLP